MHLPEPARKRQPRGLEVLRGSRLARRLGTARDRVLAARHFDRGLLTGPSSFAKRRHLLRIFHARGHDTFVESGTHRGDTVAAFVPHARRIISVELDSALYEFAVRRFAAERHVEIILGDAIEEIPRLMQRLGGGWLLWLDGHFSGGVTARGQRDEPVLEILAALSGLRVEGDATVVVDDLRLFGRHPEFPPLDELVRAARLAFRGGRLVVGLDSLVILS